VLRQITVVSLRELKKSKLRLTYAVCPIRPPEFYIVFSSEIGESEIDLY